MRKSLIVFALAAMTAAPVHQLYAAACLCVKRSSDDRVLGYSCNDTTGEGGAAECQQSCKKANYPYYELRTDTNCDELYRRLKKQTIDIDLKPTITTPIGPITVPIQLSAKLSNLYDEMELPDLAGGGKSFLKAEEYGEIRLQLDKSDKEDVLKIKVLEVKAAMPSLKISKGETGAIEQTLNEAFESEGEIDLKTGKIWLVYSGRLRFANFPGQEASTYSLYSGQCFDCLAGGSVRLSGDSIYILD